MSICALCEQPVIDGQHNYMKLLCPGNHIFHLRCGIVGTSRIYSQESCECRLCSAENYYNNVIVEPPVEENVPSYQEANRLLDNKMDVVENKITQKTKDNLDRKMDAADAKKIKEYVKHGLKMKKLDARMRKFCRKKVKEFQLEVADLTRLYNIIYRKYYKAIIDSDEVKEFQSHYRSWLYKHKRFTEIAEKYRSADFDSGEFNFLRTLGYKNVFTFFHSRVNLFVWYTLRDLKGLWDIKNINK